MNQVILIGSLGKEPECINKNKDHAFVKLSVATTRSYKNAKGEWVSNTEWHSVNVNDKLADYASSNLHKGANVFVKGWLHTSTWQDKNNVKHYSTVINASELKAFFKHNFKQDPADSRDESTSSTINNEI